jgi:two-component system cell cycle sensor histidine kinase/response regulator CckA
VLDTHGATMLAALQGFVVGRSKRRPMRALVVDDEEPLRRFVNRVLTEGGYHTVLACDGPEAEAAMNTHGPFDILVTDLMMPAMSGDELARRLRHNEPRLKVLYLTGFCDHLFTEKVTLWAGEAFLDKPCTVTGLMEAVSLLVSGTIPRRAGGGS